MRKLRQKLAGALGLSLLVLSVGIAQAADSKASWGQGPRAGMTSKKTVRKGAKARVTATPVQKEVWICPMCHIKADKAGKCPECGMDMVKLPKDAKKK